jgi:UPF0176 protein
MQFINLAGYKFVALEGLTDIRAALVGHCRQLGLKGTILLSPEGINAFVAGREDEITRFKTLVRTFPGLADLHFKESLSDFLPFDRMLVKIKNEIITLRTPVPDPAAHRAPAVAPAELRRWLDEGRDVVLLDTRNAFEVEAGTFRNALHLDLGWFGQFPQAAAALDPALKDRTVVTFCTGGIRCEKAAPVLMQQGFRDVLQLDGGILQYFEDCGDAHFDGRCFVFDQRHSLDGRLQPEVAGKE